MLWRIYAKIDCIGHWWWIWIVDLFSFFLQAYLLQCLPQGIYMSVTKKRLMAIREKRLRKQQMKREWWGMEVVTCRLASFSDLAKCCCILIRLGLNCLFFDEWICCWDLTDVRGSNGKSWDAYCRSCCIYSLTEERTMVKGIARGRGREIRKKW